MNWFIHELRWQAGRGSPPQILGNESHPTLIVSKCPQEKNVDHNYL